MLFMVMHKMTDELERGLPPSPTIIQDMGKLIGELAQKGLLHNGAGLRPTSTRVRLRCNAGACTQQPTPRRGAEELISGFVMFKVAEMPQAISWARRIGEALGDVELDVGPVTEAWDLGIAPKPPDAPLRVLLTLKSTPSDEAGKPLPASTAQKLDAVLAAMKKEGVFLATERLHPSARGARLRTAGSKRAWTDGPFAETKELISGFSILRMGSLDEAKAFAERYATILGDIEVDVRQVVEAV